MDVHESTVLSQILGPDIVVSHIEMASIDFSSIPEPFRLENVSSKRQREFYAGRLAAADALRRLGEVNTTVSVGSKRAPIWPDGVVGSIAHDDAMAIAAVAQATQAAGIGIDIEQVDRFSDGLAQRIGMKCELNLWKDRAGSRVTHPGVALFSLKESLFKCLFPSIREYFDFLDVEIYWADTELRARATECSSHLSGILSRVRGDVREVNGKMLSACMLLGS